jgi:hypothetical protein
MMHVRYLALLVVDPNPSSKPMHTTALDRLALFCVLRMTGDSPLKKNEILDGLVGRNLLTS